MNWIYFHWTKIWLFAKIMIEKVQNKSLKKNQRKYSSTYVIRYFQEQIWNTVNTVGVEICSQKELISYLAVTIFFSHFLYLFGIIDQGRRKNIKRLSAAHLRLFLNIWISINRLDSLELFWKEIAKTENWL